MLSPEKQFQNQLRPISSKEGSKDMDKATRPSSGDESQVRKECYKALR